MYAVNYVIVLENMLMLIYLCQSKEASKDFLRIIHIFR